MELGKSISLSFSVILMSDQSISKTSQIQFFLSLTFSGFNLPLILNKMYASCHSAMFYRYIRVGVGYKEQYFGVVRKQSSFE